MLFNHIVSNLIFRELMKSKPHKKLPNKKIIKTPKFEAKEQFTNSALENLKSEKERLINNLIDSGEFKPNL